MKRKIFVTLSFVATALTAFVAGRATSQPTQPEKPKTLTQIEMTLESGGLYLSYIDDQGGFYDFWLPTETLEDKGLIDTANIVDWNTNGDELAVMTKMGYEWYAYKTESLYKQYFYKPVEPID